MYTLDQVGDRLFGRTLRLRVARWVLLSEEASFFQTQAANGVGYSSPGEVAKELERLADLGMVLKNEPSPGDRRQYYTRLDDCPLWEVVRAAVAVLAEQPS